MTAEADADLAALDAGAEDDLDVGDGIDLLELLALLDPAPPLPLAAPFATGLGPLLLRWADLEEGGFLSDRRVQRVLGVLGSRYSVTITPDAITLRGLVRTRTTPWGKVQRLVLVPRSELLRERAVEQLIGGALSRLPVPVPGLAWLVGKVMDAIWRRLPERPREELAERGGNALAEVQRRGFDRDLEGLFALVSFLSEGLTQVAVGQATALGVPIHVEEG